MKARLALIAAAAVLAFASAAPAQQAQNGRKSDPVTMYAESDARMNAAIAEARGTLPVFWAAYDADRAIAATAALKVGFEGDDGSTEHMWVREIRRKGSVITGVLANRPAFVASLAQGDTVTFDAKQISDWSYVRFDRMYGSYTTRVMLPELTPEQQAQYREFLSDKPLEDGRL